MKNNKGFSLVELIVVIAIMAVLAAVAVVGLSVYIPKAQQAADQQMVADIQKAIDLYAQLEGAELQPGQSGYVVIKKTGSNGGGAISFVVMPVGAEEETPGNGNVTVGDTIDDGKFVHDALVSYFGEDYGTELKVSYGGWTNIMTEQEVEAIQNSEYIKDVDNLLETVQMLTDAMKGYYGEGATNADANQAVLDVAKDTQTRVKKEEFIAWWLEPNLLNGPPAYGFDFDGIAGTNDALKIALAAQYARQKAFVLSTGCSVCSEKFFGDENGNYFSNITSSGEASAAYSRLETNTKTHVEGCPQCYDAYSKYFSAEGSARSDAEAYIALLGQIDGMSDMIQGSDEFNKDGLYTSGFVKDVVNEYVNVIQTYDAVDANEGDIVISFIVDKDGNIKFTNNLSE